MILSNQFFVIKEACPEVIILKSLDGEFLFGIYLCIFPFGNRFGFKQILGIKYKIETNALNFINIVLYFINTFYIDYLKTLYHTPPTKSIWFSK